MPDRLKTVSAAFAAADFVLFFIQLLYVLARPQSKSRRWYLGLLACQCTFNVVSACFPDPDLSIPVSVQYLVKDGIGLWTLGYMGFYIQRIYSLPKGRLIVLYGTVTFIIIPFVFLYIFPYYMTGDLSFSRKLLAIAPLIFETVFIWMFFRAFAKRFNIKSKSALRPPDLLSSNIIPSCFALLCWAFYPALILFGELEAYEQVVTNAGFHIMTAGYIHRGIRKAKDEYSALKNQSEALGQFAEDRVHTIYNLAYEMKAPLTFINNSLLEFRQMYNYDENNAELAGIQAGLSALISDVDAMFAAKHLNDGVEVYDHGQLCDMSAIVSRRLQIYSSPSSTRGVILAGTVVAGMTVKADSQAIKRVVNTLLENAIKYTEKGGTVLLSLNCSDSQVVLEVSDSGRGIPPEIQNRVFDFYYNISKKRRYDDGLGISLYLCYKILEEIGGTITLNSEVNIGTKFIVSLPKHRMDAHSLPLTEGIEPAISLPEKIQDAITNPECPHILVAANTDSMLSFLCRILSRRYNVYVARNGDEAMDRLNSLNQVDLIVSEIQMEKKDGLALIKELSEVENLKHIPVMFISVQSSHTLESEAIELGAFDFFDSIMDANRLMRRIDNILKNVDKQKKAVLQTAFRMSKMTSPLTHPGAAFERNCQRYRITAREVDVIKLLRQGVKNEEIADRLNISKKTVDGHLTNIYQKVGVNSRVRLFNVLEGSPASNS